MRGWLRNAKVHYTTLHQTTTRPHYVGRSTQPFRSTDGKVLIQRVQDQTIWHKKFLPPNYITLPLQILLGKLTPAKYERPRPGAPPLAAAANSCSPCSPCALSALSSLSSLFVPTPSKPSSPPQTRCTPAGRPLRASPGRFDGPALSPRGQPDPIHPIPHIDRRGGGRSACAGGQHMPGTGLSTE